MVTIGLSRLLDTVDGIIDSDGEIPSLATQEMTHHLIECMIESQSNLKWLSVDVRAANAIITCYYPNLSNDAVTRLYRSVYDNLVRYANAYNMYGQGRCTFMGDVMTVSWSFNR